jgi:DNA-binding PadR family transcriptional regulator
MLSESRDAPDRGLDRQREYHLRLPDGETRDRIVSRDREYRLRGSEVNLMETIGRYRAVFVEDLARETSDVPRLDNDLASLERQGLLEVRTIDRLDEARSADVVALTEEGKALLDDHRDPDQDHDQQYYGGWVKPAELWHDAALYHMVRDVEIEVDRDEGDVTRVILDDELKGRAYAELHRLREDEGLSDGNARDLVATVQDLHLEDGHFVFPDVRLEIQDATGNVRTVDLELVTEHFRSRQRRRRRVGGLVVALARGEAEVEDLWPPIRRDDDVQRFEVAMKDPVSVGMGNRLRDLVAQSDDALGG